MPRAICVSCPQCLLSHSNNIYYAHARSTFSAYTSYTSYIPAITQMYKTRLKLHPNHEGWRWRDTIYMYSITACRHFAALTADSKVVYMLFQELILK